MPDLLRKNEIGETPKTHIPKDFDIFAATEGVSIMFPAFC